jgi:hypothetical protein
MLGEALMVSPVTTNVSNVIKPHFTAGAWYSAWDFDRLDSTGQTISMDVPLGDIAVHLRGGAIVPMQQYARVTRDVRWSPVSLVVALPAESPAKQPGPVLPYALDEQCANARNSNPHMLVSCGLLYADDDAPEVSDADSLQTWFIATTNKEGDSGTIASTITAAATALKEKLRITQIEIIGLPKHPSATTTTRRSPATVARTSMEAWRSDRPAVSFSAGSRSGAAQAHFDGSKGVLKVTGLDLLASEPFSINWHMA